MKKEKELEKDSEDESLEDEQLFTIFELNGEDFGVSVESMDEIVKDVDSFNVPASPDYVLGATNLRGNVVPILDLKSLLGLGKTEDTWEEVLLLRFNGKRYAMPVDKVKDMIAPKKDQMVNPSSITNLRDKNIEWMIKLDTDRSVRVIDVGEILDSLKEDLDVDEIGE